MLTLERLKKRLRKSPTGPKPRQNPATTLTTIHVASKPRPKPEPKLRETKADENESGTAVTFSHTAHALLEKERKEAETRKKENKEERQIIENKGITAYFKMKARKALVCLLGYDEADAEDPKDANGPSELGKQSKPAIHKPKS